MCALADARRGWVLLRDRDQCDRWSADHSTCAGSVYKWPIILQCQVWNWHGADMRCVTNSSVFGGVGSCAQLVSAEAGAYDAKAMAGNGIPGVPFAIHILTPILADGHGAQWCLVGEMGSQDHVSLSPRRFSAVSLDQSSEVAGSARRVGLAFTVRGAPGEFLDIATARPALPVSAAGRLDGDGSGDGVSGDEPAESPSLEGDAGSKMVVIRLAVTLPASGAARVRMRFLGGHDVQELFSVPQQT